MEYIARLVKNDGEKLSYDIYQDNGTKEFNIVLGKRTYRTWIEGCERMQLAAGIEKLAYQLLRGCVNTGIYPPLTNTISLGDVTNLDSLLPDARSVRNQVDVSVYHISRELPFHELNLKIGLIFVDKDGRLHNLLHWLTDYRFASIKGFEEWHAKYAWRIMLDNNFVEKPRNDQFYAGDCGFHRIWVLGQRKQSQC